MDPALLVLASASGTALVQAMATDAWGAVRDRVARLLGRGDTGRETAALERLDASHDVVHQAGPGTEVDVSGREEVRWSSRFEVLLDESPAAAEQLRSLIALIENALGQIPPGGAVTQHISAGRDAYVAGHDQFIGRSGDEGQG